MRTLRGMTIALAAASLLTGCAAIPALPWGVAGPALPVEVEEFEDPPAPPVGECPWESEAEESGAVIISGFDPDKKDLAFTEAVALEDELFWPLIESIPSSPEPQDFTAAASALAGCSTTDVYAFQARLTLALYELDGPENLAWFEQNDPSGFGFASDDVFLYARCATVLGGLDNWNAAVRDRTLEWGDDAPDLDGMSEHLLYITSDAALAQGISLDDYYDSLWDVVPLSFETGSNTELWGE